MSENVENLQNVSKELKKRKNAKNVQKFLFPTRVALFIRNSMHFLFTWRVIWFWSLGVKGNLTLSNAFCAYTRVRGTPSAPIGTGAVSNHFPLIRKYFPRYHPKRNRPSIKWTVTKESQKTRKFFFNSNVEDLGSNRVTCNLYPLYSRPLQKKCH